MQWIEPCTVISIAAVGGLVGGCLMAISQKSTNRLNQKMMEDYWRGDHFQMKAHIQILMSKCAEIEKKISTVSVDNSVQSPIKKYKNHSYNNHAMFQKDDKNESK